jgi:hypothetical protein
LPFKAGVAPNQFSYFENGAKLPCIFQSDKDITLPLATVVIDEKVWYYEMDISEYAWNNQLKSSPLKNFKGQQIGASVPERPGRDAGTHRRHRPLDHSDPIRTGLGPSTHFAL